MKHLKQYEKSINIEDIKEYLIYNDVFDAKEYDIVYVYKKDNDYNYIEHLYNCTIGEEIRKYSTEYKTFIKKRYFKIQTIWNKKCSNVWFISTDKP